MKQPFLSRGGAATRWAFPCLLALAGLAAGPVRAEAIASAEACSAAVAADPAKAREAAALWERSGGGVAARLCEADALAAMGAHVTAATLLTRLGETPGRAIGAGLRAVIFGDAAREWLAADRPDLALAVLGQADALVPADGDRMTLRARAAAAEGDWPGAQAALAALLAAHPDDALGHALMAAALRRQGDLPGALAEAQQAKALAPTLPEAMFEEGAALAETGQKAPAQRAWMALIEAYPDSALAEAARASLAELN